MVQLWIENKIFQIRIVSEKEHESPGILAKDCLILDGQSKLIHNVIGMTYPYLENVIISTI